MRFLRQNTAVIITVGPFYDKTDGVTIETGLTITNERITLTADTDDNSAPTNILDNVTGATSGTDNDLNYITGNDAGMMQLELTATNTNRVGRVLLSITDAANHVPVFHEFFILPQAIYDWFTGVVTPLPANVTQLSGDSTAADNAEAFFDGTGYAGTNNVIPTVTTLTGHTAQTGDAFARLGAPAGASVSADIAAIEAQTDDIGVAGAGLTALVDLVWDELLTGAAHNTATSAGRRLRQLGDAVAGTVNDVSATTTEFNTNLTAVNDFYNDQVLRFTSGALAGQAKPVLSSANANGRIVLAEALTSAPSNNDTFDIIPNHVHPITQIATGVRTELTTELGRIDAAVTTRLASAGYTAPDNANIAAIVADTNELQTDWANGGRLDLILDARASQTSVDDVPTNTELTTALGTADDAVLAAIAALNNLSAAQVNAEVVDALTVDVLADSVATDGSRPTIGQAALMILRFLTEKSVSGTTVTVKKEDGTTTSMTFTLDSGTTPTSVTRAS